MHGDGSLCPALVGNPSLRGLQAIMFTSWFENGDGLLVICPKEEPEMLRLLLTDSGHYILPTDTNTAAEVSQNDKKEVTLFCTKVANASSKKWNDVSSRVLHVFTTTCSTPVVQAEGNRMSSTLTTTPRSTTTSADTLETPEKVKKTVHWEDQCGGADNNQTYDEKITAGTSDVSHNNGILPSSSCAEDHGHHERFDNSPKPCSLTPTTILELEQKNNQIQEHDIEPKVNVVDNYHSSDFPGYSGDMLPENVDHTKMTKRYKAIKEEFYTRTGHKPVTPYNFKKWMAKMKGRGVKWHFWEWFSGSGRLSLTMLLAGLSVGFPVDLRYGWNINDLSHQAMLREAQAEFQPGVLMCAPDCAPWKAASNSKDPQVRQAERDRDQPGIDFTQNSCEKQSKHGRGFVVEQPYGSAMWTDGLQLENIQDYRKKQRVDQCMHGAVDEAYNPVQKATGLGSNIKFKKTAIRCGGHKGRQHAHLCGQVGGVNRTAAAAVYPRQMCQRMRLDIMNFLHKRIHKRNLMNIKTESFYECIRCQLGRFCPKGVDHTMVPGQCRHGRYSPGTHPRQISSASAADPISDWKKVADREALEQVDLQNHLEHELTVEDSHYLKKLLVETINNALGLFNEASNRKIDYSHWVDNPVAMALFKEIFKDIMQVKGIKVELRPFSRTTAEPTLPMSSAYLRLPVQGHVKAWTIGPVEDMREMSFSQINADIDEADWMVTLYGVEHDAVPAPSTPGSHPRALPPQPALPPRQDDAALVPLPEVQERPGDPQEAAAVAEPAYEEFDLHGRQSLAPIRPS